MTAIQEQFYTSEEAQRGGPLPPPSTLTPAAKKVWVTLLKGSIAGEYASSDIAQLTIFVEAKATFDLATKMLAKPEADGGGYLSKGATGQTTVSPWFAIQTQAANRIDKIGASLFLNPAARQAMRTPAKPAETIQATSRGLIQ